MEQTLVRWFAVLLNQWHQATLVDYAHMVLAIVVGGWFVSKYYSQDA